MNSEGQYRHWSGLLLRISFDCMFLGFHFLLSYFPVPRTTICSGGDKLNLPESLLYQLSKFSIRWRVLFLLLWLLSFLFFISFSLFLFLHTFPPFILLILYFFFFFSFISFFSSPLILSYSFVSSAELWCQFWQIFINVSSCFSDSWNIFPLHSSKMSALNRKPISFFLYFIQSFPILTLVQWSDLSQTLLLFFLMQIYLIFSKFPLWHFLLLYLAKFFSNFLHIIIKTCKFSSILLWILAFQHYHHL